ncbi:polymorphic toxin-type HINT domain-containing protein [Streptomyces sp. NPDC006645]|uniref:polymorphic toxin-type HINT domain-containing protein n=1 Tax=unclassified Streptomyces TaxID=2593676 RepID=UPI00339F890B
MRGKYGTAGGGGPRVRIWLRRVAVVTGFALMPGLLSPVVFADDPASLGAPKLAAPKAAEVIPFTAKVNKKQAAVMKKAADTHRRDTARAKSDRARTVTWPQAGRTTLTPSATGTAQSSAGGLPLSLIAASSLAKKQKPVNGAVEVTVLDQKQAAQLGIKGVVLTVTGPATGGTAQLSLNYKKFASAYGGDWAGRLQIQRLPNCALTDPAASKCRTRTPLDFTNDRAHSTVTAPVAFTSAASSGRTVVLALAAGSESGAGDYKATPLSASSTWEAGGSSGTFTWSYPLRTPPAAAGPAPDLSISYDSGSVDGRTGSTNNQGTAIGEGFDITSSYIERKYGSCDDDGQDDKFDQCWKYDNASVVLNGKASELVKQDGKGGAPGEADEPGVWRLKNDDASTVTHSTGADNGDDNGEYWTIITGEGTKYVFGLSKLDGAPADERTDSVWTVPVFGDDSGEPGYKDGTSFSGRDKKQAWRWNLDYVEDTRANAMSYWYDSEINYYDKLGDDNTGTAYTRGGWLKEIRYGQRAKALFSGSPAASNKVVFSYKERCVATGTGCDSLTEDARDNWPDVPFDSVCKEGDKCTGNVGPSFFTRKRMTAISTYAWNAAAAIPDFAPVDTWALKQQYLDPGDTGDSSDQSLWLDEIRHTGRHGTEIALPPVTFTHEFLANRVDGNSDDILPLHKPRLYTITSETGAQSVVNYLPADCTAGQAKPAVDTNTKRCYPVYWSPNGEKTPILDWFQKYPVQAVSTTDPHGGSEAVEHTYTYTGGGAWHYNDDPMIKEKERTWSSWRGYGQVTHVTGRPGKTQSKTATVYLRGMNGDRVLGSDGKTPHATDRKSVTVTGIKAPGITDSDQYAGFTRESVTYNGAQEVSGKISDPWSKKTATQHKSYADTEAYFVRVAATHDRTNITTTGTPRDRIRTATTTYDDYGMPETVDDKGDNAVTGDEKCTRTWYARNDTVGINNLVARTRTVAQPCATTDTALDLPVDSTRPGDVVSDTAIAYDTTTWTQEHKPTKGERRWTGRATSYGADNQPAWQKITTVTYDALGRQLTVKDTNDTTTSTNAYTPAETGPLTATTVTNAKSHRTISLLDYATAAPLKVTDPNNKVSESTYDALGRIKQAWLPNSPRSGGKSPNYVYDYGITATDPPWVSTGTLQGDAAGYNTTYEIYDSQLRPRQTQSPSPLGGRVIGLTMYDDRGLAVSSQSDIWDDETAPTSVIAQTEGGQAPVQNDTTYDGAGRAVKAVTMHFGRVRWTTETAHTGDTVTNTAPIGGQATAVVTDALGQTTQRREYAGTQPTGADFTTTDFTYTGAGRQHTVTGPDRAKWIHTYDLFGRKASSTDPDSGTVRTQYDELDRAISTTNALSKTVLSEYDALGRQTGLWDNTKTDATKLAAWTFDTLAKGQVDTSVRYEGGLNGKSYTTKVTAYDPVYNVTGTQLTLPATDPLVTAGVPATLNFSTVYNVDGTVRSNTHPAAGGLPAEAVSNKYNDLGLQTSASGTGAYLKDATYSELGDLRQLTPYTSQNLAFTFGYEPGTRRLKSSIVSDTAHPGRLQDLNFTQDDAGNITSIFDAATQGTSGTTKTDNQCFTYDGHRRLIEAWTPRTPDCATTGRTTANLDGEAPYWSSYTYTTGGQRKTETKHTTTGNNTTTYAYGTPTGQPHPLASTTGVKTGTYTYDKSGSTTSRPGVQAQQTLTWNTEGKLATTTEPAAGTKPATGTSYLYDADGELLISRNTTGDGDTVLYLGGGSEVRLTTKGTAKTLTGTRYYTAAGKTIALRTATLGTTGSKLAFLAGDHHGTSSLAIDAATLAVTKRYTTPFGAPRGSAATTWPDDKGFLGKPADSATGLTHIGAREYDPGVGQFISIDPVLAVDQHQSMNGYAYANQNPATYADPTGLWIDNGNGQSEIRDDGHGDHNTLIPATGKHGEDQWPVPGGSGGGGKGGGGGTASAPSSGGGGKGGGSDCGFWSKCGWVNAFDDAGNWIGDNKGMIASVVTEVVVGGACFGAAAGAGLATGGVGFGAAAGCGAVAGAAGSAIGNAFDDNADHSVSGQLSAQADGAIWGAAGAGAFYGVGQAAKFLGKCHSFLPGTGVLLADGTRRAIEEIDVGDTVVTTDTKTGKTTKKKVVATITTEDDEDFTEITISLDDDYSSIVATDTHPFWVPELRKWVKAGDLYPGQRLRTSAGTHVQITATTHYTKQQRTHDLTIQDIHAYYVLAGETPVLVHNATPGQKCDLTLGAGPNAREGVGLENGDIEADGVRDLINESGNKYGCHTCDARTPGTKDGDWIPDHQPPSSLVPPGSPQTAYPHCLPCARRQGGVASQLSQGKSKKEW